MDEVEELIRQLEARATHATSGIEYTEGDAELDLEAAKALTVSPEELSDVAERIGELKLGGSKMPLRFYYSDDSLHFVARAAAIALGLKCLV